MANLWRCLLTTCFLLGLMAGPLQAASELEENSSQTEDSIPNENPVEVMAIPVQAPATVIDAEKKKEIGSEFEPVMPALIWLTIFASAHQEAR